MLQRDSYHQDPTMSYFPNFSLQKFQQHIGSSIMSTKPYYKLIFNQQQSDRWNSRISFVNNVVTALFTIGLVPCIFYKKTPILKRFTSRKARILWTIAILFIPPNIANGFLTMSIQNEIQQSYQANMMDFMRYRQTGDIQVMNPKIEFVEN